jgi:hypothetical protein
MNNDTAVTADFMLGPELSVTKKGPGSGTVTSFPAGIACGASCSNHFTPGTAINLTPTPDQHSTFAGWGGACFGAGATCELTLNADRSVSAAFIGPPNTKISGAAINQAAGRATFKFKAVGVSKAEAAIGFKCALLKKKHAKRKFRRCTSPKKYKHLKPHRYMFEVRAFDAAGKDPTPAKRKFKIK